MGQLQGETRTEAAIRAFMRAGWERPGRRKGSHEVLKRPGHSLLTVVHPRMHKRLLEKLISRAGLTVDEFLGFL
jgi:predicted RNA binding protein YcfA (HicA-like mRNA interferase family)